MRLFINSGVCKRKWNGNVIIRQRDKVITLKFPNYNEKTKKEEYVEFVIPNCSKKMLKKDVLLSNLSLTKESESRYIFSEVYDTECASIYVLVRSTVAVPDDVFIPYFKREKVEVICRLRFIDDECDLGDFLSNVYLLKITLNKGEDISLYLTYQDSKYLEKKIWFYRPSVRIGDNSNWIIMHKTEKKSIEGKTDYISLSELK